VPPELVFDQRIGDIFSARIAGNVAEDDIVGSAESRPSWPGRG
jgi:carbonic anhydrase